MVRNNLDLQQAIGLVDDKIRPKHLNKVQEIILIKSLEGQTYSQIAIEHNYGMEYIKTSGSELWKLLSKAFGQQVNKSNCNSFIRRQVLEFTTDLHYSPKQGNNIRAEQADIDINSAKQEIDSISLIAPKIFNFRGRESELATLKNWSNDPDCYFILLTGVVGCGKTTLAIRAAQILRKDFYRVVYLSMSNSRELKDLIEFCLHSLDPNIKLSSDINKLLVDFALYLKKYKCLIIIDDLDSIFEFKQTESYYRSGCEQYAQFLRCLVTTNHQSSIIASSRNDIKQLNYYSSKRVRFMALEEMNPEVLWSIFEHEIAKDIPKEAWQQICNYYQNNPELIKIVVRNIDYFPVSNEYVYDRYIPQLEEIDSIIGEELKLLDEISKEVVYWLSFNFENYTSVKLSRRINCQHNKVLKALNFLKRHSLIMEENCNYFLKSMYADYVQRYLIKAARKFSN